MSLSADHTAKPLEPRTLSAAHRWLKTHPGQEQIANQVT